jgi:tetratricopeptide (TPR) repeat protein
VHWAEQTLLEAIDELARSLRAPALLLCTARPVLLEAHKSFVDEAPVVLLSPLSEAECERFLALLLDDTGLEARAVRRLVDAAGGNPLFLEQLLSMLIDDGRLREEGGHWRLAGDLTALQVPATIEALVAARIDRLPTDERRVLEPASVIGRSFLTEAVAHLVDAALRPAVPERLHGLAERDLILPMESEEPAYRFEHQLVRDATYTGLLKEARAILHERFVDWGDAVNRARDRATEFEEIQGYHLEQAYRYWRELGPLDDHAVELGVDAARRLGSAGERALARGDMAAASNLLGRAADLLPHGHPDQPRLLLHAGNALHETGEFDRAITAYDVAAAIAAAQGNEAAAEAGRIEHLKLQYLTGRLDEDLDVGAVVEQALQRLTVLGDPDALSRAWNVRLNVEIAACRWAEAQHAAEAVIEQAHRAGNAVLEVRTMPLLAFLAQKGPMPVDQATATCREILERVSFDRRSTGTAQLELATLSAMALDLDTARRLCLDTRQVLGELGWEMQAALVSLSSGLIELMVDEPARAEAELRQDYEALERMQERYFISLTAALLAEAVYRQRRFDEASQLVGFSRALAAPDDLAVQIIARSVDGKLALRRGDTADGLALVREAVALIHTTEDPSGQGDALLDLAEALFLAGETDPRAAAETAQARYAVKGNLAGLRRAERIALDLAAGQDPLA